MTHSLRTAVIAVLIGLSAVQFGPAAESTASARAPATQSRERPLVVLNLAGIDRLLADVDGLAKQTRRRDLSLKMRGIVSLSTAGLKGIDRKRPLGFMTYIDPGEAPEPVMIVYVPVTKNADFLTMLKAAGYRVGRTDDDRSRCVMIGRSRWCFTFQHNYAFFARKQKSLRRSFLNPRDAFRDLTDRYDVALRIQLGAVPDGMKHMILDYLRAGAEQERRRRAEAAADRQLHNTLTTTFLAGLHSLFRDGRNFDVGFTYAKPDGAAKVEISLKAKAGSPLASQLAAIRGNGRAMRFSPSAQPPLFLQHSATLPKSLQTIVDAFMNRETDSRKPQAGDVRPERWQNSPALRKLLAVLIHTGPQFAVWASSGKAPAGRVVPALVAVVAGTNTARQAELSAKLLDSLKQLKQSGLIDSLQTERHRRGKTIRHRISWGAEAEHRKTGAPFSKALVAVGPSQIWVVVGTGQLESTLAREKQRVQLRRSSARTGTAHTGNEAAQTEAQHLFELVVRWAVLKSLLDGRWNVSWQTLHAAPSAETADADRLHIRVTQGGHRLVLQAVLEADVVEQLSRKMFTGLEPLLKPRE